MELVLFTITLLLPLVAGLALRGHAEVGELQVGKHVAALDSTDLSFEDLDAWTVSNAVSGASAIASDGDQSLSLTQASAGNVVVKSPMLPNVELNGPTVTVDVRVPSDAPDFYVGNLALFMYSESVRSTRISMGVVDFDGLPREEFQTLTFAIPVSDRNGVNHFEKVRAGVEDLYFQLEVRMAMGQSATYMLDNVQVDAGPVEPGIPGTQQEAKLLPAEVVSSADFGKGMDADGNTLVAASDQGVQFFEFDGSQWQRGQILTDPVDDGQYHAFGKSLALDGDTLVVGAYNQDGTPIGDDDQRRIGVAYVYEKQADGTWGTNPTRLQASDSTRFTGFGRNVEIDGDTIVVYSPTADGRGAVYVFERDGAGWPQQARLRASNLDLTPVPKVGQWAMPLYQKGGFGLGLALEGDRLVVGARNEGSAATGINGDKFDLSAPQSGAVYVFERSAGTWTETTYIKGSNTEKYDSFGGSVALSGNRLLVGAGGADGGAAYAFEYDGANWREIAVLRGTPEGDIPPNLQSFGSSVSIGGIGWAVGAPLRHSVEADVWDGAAYLFSPYDFSQLAYVIPNDGGTEWGYGDYFGSRLVAGEDRLFVNSPGDDAPDGAREVGAVYVFR